MPSSLLLRFLLVRLSVCEGNIDFIYHGFRGANLSLNGNARITSTGIPELTSSPLQKGHAFYPIPLHFEPSHGKNISFSTSFVFAIASPYRDVASSGAAFVISPSKELPGGSVNQYLGIFNSTNNGNSSNHIVAIELDTILSPDVGDIDDNHVGVDINGLKSVESSPLAYFDDKKGIFKNISLISGKPMQACVEYDGVENQLNVTVFPVDRTKPSRPLISMKLDLLSYVVEDMYMGFSASTSFITSYHYVLGWSFNVNGEAWPLHPSRLPELPRTKSKNRSKFLEIGLPIILIFSVLMSTFGVVAILSVRRKRKLAKVHEDWEREYV